VDPVVQLLLGLLGAFAGFLGALLGIGGGVIVVPILVLVFLLNTHVAVGTSLSMILFTALASTYAYFRQKRIDWKVGIATALVTAPGALIGAYATKFFSSRDLAIILGVSIFCIAIGMLYRSSRPPQEAANRTGPSAEKTPSSSRKGWSRRLVDSTGKAFEYDASIYSGLILLFVGGLASGFLGIGGGLIVVPILTVLVGLPMHIAVATSMLAMIFTSISGVSTHIMLGNVRIEYVVPLAIGIVFGAQAGARAAKRLRSATLERVFAVAVLLIGIVLIVTRVL
jgi:uncharacterized membrane protein YfcA